MKAAIKKFTKEAMTSRKKKERKNVTLSSTSVGFKPNLSTNRNASSGEEMLTTCDITSMRELKVTSLSCSTIVATYYLKDVPEKACMIASTALTVINP